MNFYIRLGLARIESQDASAACPALQSEDGVVFASQSIKKDDAVPRVESQYRVQIMAGLGRKPDVGINFQGLIYKTARYSHCIVDC